MLGNSATKNTKLVFCLHEKGKRGEVKSTDSYSCAMQLSYEPTQDVHRSKARVLRSTSISSLTASVDNVCVQHAYANEADSMCDWHYKST